MRLSFHERAFHIPAHFGKELHHKGALDTRGQSRALHDLCDQISRARSEHLVSEPRTHPCSLPDGAGLAHSAPLPTADFGLYFCSLAVLLEVGQRKRKTPELSLSLMKPRWEEEDGMG